MTEDNKTKRTMRFVVSNCSEEVVEKLKNELSPDIVTRIVNDLATEAIDFEKHSGRPQSLIKTLNYLALLSQKEVKTDSESTSSVSNQEIGQSSSDVSSETASESHELDVRKDSNDEHDESEQIDLNDGVRIDADAMSIGSMLDMFSQGEQS